MFEKKYWKEMTGSIKKMFYFSDPGCYELVNKTQVTTDVESGDPEFGYDKL